MEFGEKLQTLRKRKGLTQEELAEFLHVSRTAISKWESGRGYPNIDSLKEIANYFSVSIDELLSGERLITIAETENKSNIRNLCRTLFGMMDLISFVLIVLPLYPKTVAGYVYSVNLPAYVETAGRNRYVYWIAFLALIVMGVFKILLTKLNAEAYQKAVTVCSMALSTITVFFLAIAREPYALTVVFSLLIIKGILLFKQCNVFV